MSTVTAEGSRIGEPRQGWDTLLAEVAFVPERARGPGARALLVRDGAVLLPGLPVDPDSLTVAAAEVFGAGLTHLYPVRVRAAEHGEKIHLHNDSHHIALDVHGRRVQLRDPDEDHVLLQCARQALSGGESVVCDAYRLVDRLRDELPELWEFLTTVDVDYYGGWPPARGVPTTPQVCRHVEWTRAGRRIVRANQGATPIWRGRAVSEAWAAHQEAMLDLYADLRATLATRAPRFTVREGEILVLDNYRCWHGRDPHDTPRTVHIITVRTTEAM